MAVLLLGVASGARASDYSLSLGTTPVRVIPAVVTGAVRTLIMLQLQTAGDTVACSWSSTTPTLGGAGTFSIAGQAAPLIIAEPPVPGTGESGVPDLPLYCLASAAGAILTAEAWPQ